MLPNLIEMRELINSSSTMYAIRGDRLGFPVRLMQRHSFRSEQASRGGLREDVISIAIVETIPTSSLRIVVRSCRARRVGELPQI